MNKYLAKVKPYAVVENVGDESERMIRRFATYNEASDYVHRMYDLEDIDKLGIDIVGVQEDGTLTLNL